MASNQISKAGGLSHLVGLGGPKGVVMNGEACKPEMRECLTAKEHLRSMAPFAGLLREGIILGPGKLSNGALVQTNIRIT